MYRRPVVAKLGVATPLMDQPVFQALPCANQTIRGNPAGKFHAASTGISSSFDVMELHQPRFFMNVFEVKACYLKHVGAKFIPCIRLGKDRVAKRARPVAAFQRRELRKLAPSRPG